MTTSGPWDALGLRALAQKAIDDDKRATPGPWEALALRTSFSPQPQNSFVLLPDNRGIHIAEHVRPDDAEVIAAMRTREPVLAAGIGRLLERNAALEIERDSLQVELKCEQIRSEDRGNSYAKVAAEVGRLTGTLEAIQLARASEDEMLAETRAERDAARAECARWASCAPTLASAHELVQENEALKAKLAAMTKARDALSDIADRMRDAEDVSELERLHKLSFELYKVGD
jgi:hypothetical protein